MTIPWGTTEPVTLACPTGTVDGVGEDHVVLRTCCPFHEQTAEPEALPEAFAPHAHAEGFYFAECCAVADGTTRMLPLELETWIVEENCGPILAPGYETVELAQGFRLPEPTGGLLAGVLLLALLWRARR